MIAVARFVRGILDDGVDGRLLDDASRVPAGAAELGFQAAAGAGDVRGAGKGEQDDAERRTDDGGGRAT